MLDALTKNKPNINFEYTIRPPQTTSVARMLFARFETLSNDEHRSTKPVKANSYNREMVQESEKEFERTEESKTLPCESSNGKN